MQPNLQTELSCALVVFFNPLTSMSFSITNFHVFFLCYVFFEPSTAKFFAITGALSFYIFSTSPSHNNLCYLKNLVLACHILNCFITDAISYALPQIICHIFISVVCNFLSSSFLKAQHSAVQHPNTKHFSHNFYTSFLSASVTKLF